jgi:cytochrome c5
VKLRTALLALVALVTVYVWWSLTHEYALDAYESDEEHFKYGSIGSETGGTLLHPIGGLLPPAPIFKALPKVCSGVTTRAGVSSYTVVSSYEDFGLIYEESAPGKKRELPVGISRRHRLGMEIVGINCALCHAGTVRTAPGAAPVVVPGMPPQQVDVQRLFRFMFDCVGSSEFTASRVIRQIENDEQRRLSRWERARYRILVPRIRGQLATLDAKIGVLTTERVTPSGPGRLDTINPGKALEVGWNLEAMLSGSRKAELIATTDFPSAWNLGPRSGFRMHWDGNFGSIDEVLHSALLAVGAKPQTLDQEQFKRVSQYLSNLEPPQFPFRHDEMLAAAGREIFNARCAHCHALEGPDVGKVSSNDMLRVDAHRLDAFTPAYATNLQVALNQNYDKSAFTFAHVQKTGGYANMPLDGIWARAPYLHNGSVPSLRDLLQPEGCRPLRFRRGSDVFDPVNVGFVSYAAPPSVTDCPSPEGRRGPTFEEGAGVDGLFEFDTTLPGNRNIGHTGPGFGTDLTPEQKRQLIEFLKTL